MVDHSAVTAELMRVRDDMRKMRILGDVDIRLQVSERLYHGLRLWSVHWGLPDYDCDHSGYWGAAEMSANASEAEVSELASQLIAECAEQAESDHV